MPLVTLLTRQDSLKVCITSVQNRFGAVLSRIAERGVHLLGWQFRKPLLDLVVHTNSVLSHSSLSHEIYLAHLCTDGPSPVS
jgi:hypothetical protein